MSITLDYKPSRRQGQIICDSDTLGVVRNHFSVKNPAKDFVRDKSKSRFIKDRKYAITPSGLFDFGFYGEILKYLRDSQITDVELTTEFKKRLNCGFGDCEFWNELIYDERYFQKDTVDRCINRGMGTVVIGTGGGKSLTQALLIENYIRHNPVDDFKCLILVPGLSLVDQLQKNFEEYGVTFTYSGWTGETPLQDTQVVICNMENFHASFVKHQWIVGCHLLITDECHKVNGSSGISKLIKKIKTPNKFGFTGSLSDKPIDVWETIGVFGPIVYEKKSKELRDEGFLVDVKVTRLRMNHRPILELKYNDELKLLYECSKRNKIIGKLSESLNGNVLIMVNHLDHGDFLLHEISKISSKRVFFVKGEVEVDDRVKIIKMMEENDDIICVAMSSIFSTGINIKNLPNIIFAGLGKSFIRVVQSIGRGLRLHENKVKLNIVDISDNYKYSSSHSDHRMEIYDKEEIPWVIKEINLW